MSHQPLSGVTLESFEQLESQLLGWRSFTDENTYDVAGMMALFCACLNNLNQNATDDEIQELSETFSEEEKQFIRRLCSVEPGSQVGPALPDAGGG